MTELGMSGEIRRLRSMATADLEMERQHIRAVLQSLRLDIQGVPGWFVAYLEDEIRARDDEIQRRARLRALPRWGVRILPRDCIETLKAQADIVDIIGETVALRRVGRNFVGLCPFHDDRDPSLTVYPQSQSWFCYSCNIGGDCLDWLQKRNGLTFREALGRLMGDYHDLNGEGARARPARGLRIIE